MNEAELESYLHNNIPLTAAMGVRVRSLEPSLVVSAPLAPNLNHQRNAFGGSIATLAISAGWSWLRLRVDASYDIVIKSCDIEYLAPIRTEFEARCAGATPQELDAFLRRLSTRGRARLTLATEIRSEGETRAKMTAVYVALSSAVDPR